MRSTQYFGQTAGMPGNELVSSPVNNPIDAQRFADQMRQAIPASQVEYGRRRMVKWLVPERGIIEMYLNPSSIKFSHKKLIDQKRTKGGFVIQYWGEDAIGIAITGMTGSSGIEGINVLMDVYRAEQVAFDVIAIEELAKTKNEDEALIEALVPMLAEVTDIIEDLGDETISTGLAIPKPTLGFYAATIEMYYMGEVYRGYFSDFSFDENINELGLFPYTLNFVALQKRGYRRNYLPWQHSAIAGPSNHQSVPYTFGTAIPVPPRPPRV